MNSTSTHQTKNRKVTNRATYAAIRALGMSVHYSADWSEWIVNYRVTDSRRTDDSSYHTNDKQDAIDTASRMAQWEKL